MDKSQILYVCPDIFNVCIVKTSLSYCYLWLKLFSAFELRIARAAMTKVDKDQDTQEMSGPLTR